MGGEEETRAAIVRAAWNPETIATLVAALTPLILAMMQMMLQLQQQQNQPK